MYLNKTYVDNINMVANNPEAFDIEELNIDEGAVQSVEKIKVIENSIRESIISKRTDQRILTTKCYQYWT